MNVNFKMDFAGLRDEMVENAVFARGVRSELVLNAMRAVPREAFLPERLREFAYQDSPLPIEEGQTISQPYIVAFMTEALALQGGERVLEIGAGSGYAAAVLSEIAGEVYTVERIGQLAEKAAATLADLGYRQCACSARRRHARDGPSMRPTTRIIVAAGGPTIPESLKEQLKIGGRLVIPVGRDPARSGTGARHPHFGDEYRREDFADVRFVPLHRSRKAGRRRSGTGARAAPVPPFTRDHQRIAGTKDRRMLRAVRHRSRRPISIRLMARIGDARVVLLGEATPWHLGILSHARADHARADREERLPLRGDRRRLAGCRARRPLCAASRVSSIGMDGLCALSDLDVAK